MESLYREGDRVLTFNWTRLKENDVVVFNIKGKYYLKRIIKINGNRIIVRGDNKSLSSNFKPIDLGQVVGRVILKY